ncbi:219_t:CDS:2, partial [Gigaspora margarita]
KGSKKEKKNVYIEYNKWGMTYELIRLFLELVDELWEYQKYQEQLEPIYSSKKQAIDEQKYTASNGNNIYECKR